MMSKTAKDLIEHCKSALKNNVKYIYGAKMQVLTRQQISELQKIYGRDYVWDSDLNKAGHICCDCSGLISSCTGIVRSSSQYKATAEETAEMANVKADWGRYVGWAFWMQGHIGVVSEKEGYYYAMDGSARNMVHYPISRQGWSLALKLRDIDYTGGEDMTEAEVRKIASEVAAKISNDMIYKYSDKVYNSIDEVPDWGKAAVKKLIDNGVLIGSGNKLDISYTLLRLLVINDRAGVYDINKNLKY